MTATTPTPATVLADQLDTMAKLRVTEWLRPEVLAPAPIAHDGFNLPPRAPLPSPARYAKDAVEHMAATLEEVPDV